ncbi:sodium/calcium exchanger protein [Capsaspora owczarzaki ATCC 30864]|uniref:Sodium/calcium exchanger protein n=1 Tax=Capsaspora owczarzaki (strain ATCC 30864) TaxID=595528 RepID=A0A0D2WH26_CAPO3|nr:sodium/calcium exchanger protein [Capsaspora owczarzaki ATCC 30864]KJE88835.1 sodium/calcium exchanger protein [Capsaspora owczarzaki ATCC 30864]|eukprot:XP_004365285.1 sodium/calcium exchanger protein [Capsaspora owczarzaki ATCC 30864]
MVRRWPWIAADLAADASQDDLHQHDQPKQQETEQVEAQYERNARTFARRVASQQRQRWLYYGRPLVFLGLLLMFCLLTPDARLATTEPAFTPSNDDGGGVVLQGRSAAVHQLMDLLQPNRSSNNNNNNSNNQKRNGAAAADQRELGLELGLELDVDVGVGLKKQASRDPNRKTTTTAHESESESESESELQSQSQSAALHRKLLSDDLDFYPSSGISYQDLKNGGVVLYIIGVLYMFFAQAIVCDEFLVPSLDLFVSTLNIPDDVAGASILAAGQGAPELFTSIIGIFIAKSDIGFGTVLGSSAYKAVMIIGIVAFATRKILRVRRWPVLRDSIFYAGALALLFIFFRDKRVQWWEAVVLVSSFIVYVLFMAFNRNLERAYRAIIRARQRAMRKRNSQRLTAEGAGGVSGSGRSPRARRSNVMESSASTSSQAASPSVPPPIAPEPSLLTVPGSVAAAPLSPSQSSTTAVAIEVVPDDPEEADYSDGSVASDASLDSLDDYDGEEQNSTESLNEFEMDDYSQQESQLNQAALRQLDGSTPAIDSFVAADGTLSPGLAVSRSNLSSKAGSMAGSTHSVNAVAPSASNQRRKRRMPRLRDLGESLHLLGGVRGTHDPNFRVSALRIMLHGLPSPVQYVHDKLTHRHHSHDKEQQQQQHQLQSSQADATGPGAANPPEGSATSTLPKRSSTLPMQQSPPTPRSGTLPASSSTSASRQASVKRRTSGRTSTGAGYLQADPQAIPALADDTIAITTAASAAEAESVPVPLELVKVRDDSGQVVKVVLPKAARPLYLRFPETFLARIAFVFVFPITFLLCWTIPDCRLPRFKRLFVVTFFISILWIAGFTYLVVWWTTVIGNVLGIPSAVLGLTFLGISSNMTDTLSAIIVARHGLGNMALSSCIGGSVFNLLVGLPLPWLIWTLVNDEDVTLKDVSLNFTLFIQLAMLAGVLLSLLLFRWQLSKPLGVMLVLLYSGFLVLSILLQYNKFSAPF